MSSEKSTKKISIIMGVYNCEETLAEAIDSLLNQTYTNWQLILCDDCSTDNTYDIAVSYQSKYPEKIIVFRNDTNSKLAFSLNRCLKLADGDYIGRMDGDDISVPNRFERQVEFLDNNECYDLVGTAMQRFSSNGLANVEYPIEKPDKFTLREHVPFNHATILARRKVYDVLNGYTVSKRTVRGQDSDLWFRFYHAGFSGYNLMEPLYLVREDKKAVRRRTAKVRINAYKTTVYGYKLLKFPVWWLIKPTCRLIVRLITPYFLVDLYRSIQSKIKK
ncbi:MAG: glycosyltransferase family 2 protein [Oscillospiraceae bacterium]|nr:glycosyltransferase family 2 protein [Oscillospiraceae bacterium]